MTVYDLQSYLLIIILFSPQYILQHLHKTALQLFKGKNKQMVYPAFLLISSLVVLRVHCTSIHASRAVWRGSE